MKPSQNTLATDAFSEIINYIYSHSSNLKLITNLNTISNNLGYKTKTIMTILSQHSKLTILTCDNVIAIRIKP